MFLLVVVVWRHLLPHLGRAPRPPSDAAFVGIGAASGLGSALLGSVGPLTAPFFLAKGYTRAAYIGTEAMCALVMHLAKVGAYGASNLLTTEVLVLGAAMTPATLAGAWVGKRIVARISDRVFVAWSRSASWRRACCSSPGSPDAPPDPDPGRGPLPLRSGGQRRASMAR